MAKELNNASSPLSPIGAKIFGADAAGEAGWLHPQNFVAAPSIAFLGDSLTGQGRYTYSVNANTLKRGWSVQFCSMMGGRFRTIINAGVAGDTTAMILARLQTDVLAHSPSWVVELSGINDLLTGVPTATIIANKRAIYSAILSAGCRLAICSIPCATAINTAVEKEAFYLLNKFHKEFALENNILLIDAYTAVTDVSTGYMAAAMTYDSGTHPNVAGAQRIARAAYDVFNPIIPAFGDSLGGGPLDYGNIVANGALIGDNASGTNGWGLVGSATGTGPSGWFGVESGGGSCVFSKTGQCLTMEQTSSIAGDSCSLRQVINIAKERKTGASNRTIEHGERLILNDNNQYVCTVRGLATSPPTAVALAGFVLGQTVTDGAATLMRVENITAGDTIRLTFEATATDWATPVSIESAIFMKDALEGAGATLLQSATAQAGGEYQEILQTSGVFQSMDFAIPTGCLSMLLQIMSVAAGVGTGKVHIGRVRIDKVG